MRSREALSASLLSMAAFGVLTVVLILVAVLPSEETRASAQDALTLVDTVILKPTSTCPAPPCDEDGDGDIDADDEHLVDHQGETQDHAVIFDETLKRLRSAEGPVQLVEIVHGEHDVLIDGNWVTLHHPAEGAVSLATIDSERGCTYFTDPTGSENFGDAMNGLSNSQGRSVGPHIVPAETVPAELSLNPLTHTGTSPQSDYDIVDIWVDTMCEEQATIHIDVGYPGPVGSPPLPPHEQISINWVTIEIAKQPQIRWAGEDIVLAKRWAVVDEDSFDYCPFVNYPVKFIKLGGPGGLVGGIPDVPGPPSNSEPNAVWTTVQPDCTAKAFYSSEGPGEVNLEAVLYDEDYNAINKGAFLVWYLKIYQVRLTGVEGEREFRNAGEWSPVDPWDTASDVAARRNVSSDALLQVTVKGWFRSSNPSDRPDICIDMDGDGDGDPATTTDIPGEPYKVDITPTGCKDPDDELLSGGYWVLPDDMARLAGPHPDRLASWDVMQAPDGATSDSPGLVGPKSTLDSHDAVARPWIPCLPGTCPRKTVAPDGAVDVHDALMPPLKIEAMIADPLDQTDNDADTLVDEDAGFLKEASKKLDVYTGGTNLYYRIMIPADPQIPPFVRERGYDWDSWLCRTEEANLPPESGIPCPPGLHGLALGPYEFYTIVNEAGSDTPSRIEFYTDNRGEGFFFVNGDYNLSSGGAGIDAVTGTPGCSPGDVVATTEIKVIGDYPYFPKHPAVQSNPVVETWEGGGRNADLKIVDQYVADPPAEIPASEDVRVVLEKVIHNNGSYEPVDAVTETVIAVPAGCTVSPNPHVQWFHNLPASVDILHHEPFTIHCRDLGEHTFVFDNQVTVTSPNTVDPDPSNDTWSTEFTVTAVAEADVKITSASFLSPPGKIPRGQDVDITLRNHIHNNGLWTPVDIAINSTAAPPTGCTVVPKNVPASIPGVPVSVDQVVDEVWTVRCTQTGLKTFVFNPSIDVATPYVSDPNLANNTVRKLLTVRDPSYPYQGDDICDGQDNDGDTVTDEGWDLLGSPVADCLDPALDTDSDTLTNDVDADDDGDGWSDAKEGFMRTDPLNACPLDVYHDAWPPDANSSGSVNITDVLAYKSVMGGPYDRRYDLTTDGTIGIMDVLLYKPVLGTSCTGP